MIPHAYHFGPKRTGALPDEGTHPSFPKWYFIDYRYIVMYITDVLLSLTQPGE